jgi:hypothetical protein
MANHNRHEFFDTVSSKLLLIMVGLQVETAFSSQGGIAKA